MSTDVLSMQVREQGAALLRGVFAREPLIRLHEAALRCFQSIATGPSVPEHYRFSRSSHSVLLEALVEFGCEGEDDLLAPLSAAGLKPGLNLDLERLFSEAMGCEWRCNLGQSWVRKKFAPGQAPGTGYHIQNWHQDGALGASFPLQPGPAIPITDLLTCWIPLQACGTDAPGLEFVRRRQPALLHFTELDDSTLRRRFSAAEFWAPPMEFGDGLVFLNDVLHRTYVHPRMRCDRLSVEYRIFPDRSA